MKIFFILLMRSDMSQIKTNTKADVLPIRFRGDDTLIAQTPGPLGRANGKHGNIVYRKDRV